MNIADEKNRLKNEIYKIDDPDILHRRSYILSVSGESLMTDEQKVMVTKRREEYLRNPSSALTLEEFKKEIKKRHGF